MKNKVISTLTAAALIASVVPVAVANAATADVKVNSVSALDSSTVKVSYTKKGKKYSTNVKTTKVIKHGATIVQFKLQGQSYSSKLKTPFVNKNYISALNHLEQADLAIVNGKKEDANQALSHANVFFSRLKTTEVSEAQYHALNQRIAQLQNALTALETPLTPSAQDPTVSGQKYELPALSYAFNALEPHIDALTMEIHHDRHHATYVTNLNHALEKYPQFFGQPIEQLISNLNAIPEDIRTAVRNNGGGHANHSMFWKIMAPNAGGNPTGAVAIAINRDFGSFQKFKDEFSAVASGRFGSGWAWLVVNKEGKLEVTSTANQDNPIMDGLKPILCIDVWEHAYYLNYQNKRASYIDAFFNVVNWDEVNRLLNEE